MNLTVVPLSESTVPRAARSLILIPLRVSYKSIGNCAEIGALVSII